MEDIFGNVVTTDTSSVTVSLGTGPAGAILGGTLTAKASSGVASFTAVYGNVAGNYTLKVADGNLTGATSNSVYRCRGAAKQLVFGTQPGNTTAGVATSAFKVIVEDAYNNVIGNNTSTVVLNVGNGSSPNATLVGNTSVAASAGIATFNWVVGTTTSHYTLKATDGTLTAATSNLFTVVRWPASWCSAPSRAMPPPVLPSVRPGAGGRPLQ